MALKPNNNKSRRKSFHKGPRKNERIRIPEIRVIGPDGTQLGILKTEEALRLAKKVGLDLVEVAPSARPPVCRILDFGKYMYDEKQKAKSQKKVTTKLKEVKFRLNIDTHDYDTKLNRAKEFLSKGNKLKVTLFFKGYRELEHKQRGFDIVRKAIDDLKELGTMDADPKLVGRNITVTLSPVAGAAQKKKKKKETPTSDDAS